MECPICAQEKSPEAILMCHDCDQGACHDCIHRYLLDHLLRPNCMHCRESWSLSFLRESLPLVLFRSIIEKRRRIWFIMESQKSRCSHCGSHIENEIHVCDPQHLVNWRTILQTTVACPGCKIPIHKISGCYQMWCTLCCTAFDWASGQLLGARSFHNPHYSDYHGRKQKRRFQWSEMEPVLRASGRSNTEKRRWLFFLCLSHRIQSMLLADHEGCSQQIMEEFMDKSQQLVQRLLQKHQWSSCHQEMIMLIDQFNHKNEMYAFPFRIRAFTMIKV